MPAGLGFIVQAILGMMGSQSLLRVGALFVRLSEEFLVLMAVCSVRSSCVLYLVVVSMVVLSQTILCLVVREWTSGGQEQIGYGRSHLGCVSGVLSEVRRRCGLRFGE